MTVAAAPRRRRRRRFVAGSARDDELGLLALDDTYAAPTRAEVLRLRSDLPDDVLIGRLRDRLLLEGAAESLRVLAGMSRPELALLAELERKDLAAS